MARWRAPGASRAFSQARPPLRLSVHLSGGQAAALRFSCRAVPGSLVNGYWGDGRREAPAPSATCHQPCPRDALADWTGRPVAHTGRLTLCHRVQAPKPLSLVLQVGLGGQDSNLGPGQLRIVPQPQTSSPGCFAKPSVAGWRRPDAGPGAPALVRPLPPSVAGLFPSRGPPRMASTGGSWLLASSHLQ